MSVYVRTSNVAAVLAQTAGAPPQARLAVLRAQLWTLEEGLGLLLRAEERAAHLGADHHAVLAVRSAQGALEQELEALQGAIAELERA